VLLLQQYTLTNTLGPIYHGQKMIITLKMNPSHEIATNVLQVNFEMYYNYLPPSHYTTKETVHFIQATCSQIHCQ